MAKSPLYPILLSSFLMRLIDENGLKNAVKMTMITVTEYQEICGKPYTP